MHRDKHNIIIRLGRVLIEKTLLRPAMFEWQQRVCNNYSNVKDEFIEQLGTTGLRILDVGCSTGTAASQIVDTTCARGVGNFLCSIVTSYVWAQM